MKRGQPHTKLVNDCLGYLAQRSIYAWSNPTRAVYDSKRGAWRKMKGGKGVADILGMLPSGRFVAVECKCGKDTLRPDQRAFRDAVAANGGLFILARCVGDLHDKIEEA